MEALSYSTESRKLQFSRNSNFKKSSTFEDAKKKKKKSVILICPNILAIAHSTVVPRKKEGKLQTHFILRKCYILPVLYMRFSGSAGPGILFSVHLVSCSPAHVFNIL